jgi:hypothetical protein
MADCKILSGCIFFNDKMANMPGTAAGFKRKFCQGDNSKCARYIVLSALGKERVPTDLFPNQEDRARKIVAAG